jgi:hypothetical protein
VATWRWPRSSCKEGAPLDARAIPGSTAPYDPKSTLELVLPESAPRRIEVRLLRDGQRLASCTAPARISARLPGPGIYRVEVYREGRLWILPAPIYAEEEQAVK